MNALVSLHFNDVDVRTVIIDGEPWWVGLDAAALLEISRGRQALAALEDYERGTYIIGTPGGPQEMAIINESGLYSLILRSRKPIAKTFKRWLTTEVLPSIRKYGTYPPPSLDIAEVAIAASASEIPQTQAERLLEEIARWEARNEGHVFTEASPVSKQRLQALVMQREGLEKQFGRAKLWLHLMNMDIDTFYILHGRRRHDPDTLAVAEALSLAEPEERAVLLARTHAIKQRNLRSPDTR